jgi:protein ImuB
MTRWLSVWLPHWAIERHARRAARSHLAAYHDDATAEGHAHVLVREMARGLVVSAVDRAAREASIRPGQPLADARAMLPALVTHPADPVGDQRALVRLAHWFGRYGPARHVDDSGTFFPVDEVIGPDRLWVATGGVDHLFGGEARLAEDVHARLAVSGLTARLAIAATPRAAAALARFATTPRSPVVIVPPDQELRVALAPLPVESLMLDADTIMLLTRLGLRRIGDLYDLPRPALTRRFRTEAAMLPRTARRQDAHASRLLARLDQILGHAPDPRRGLSEPVEFSARRLFETPLASAEPIVALVRELAHELCAALEAAGRGAQRFTLWLYRSDQSVAKTAISTGRPVRDGDHIVQLMADRIATLDAGFGIDAMVLAATRTGARAAAAEVLGRADVAIAHAADALLDRLVNRLGGAAVLRLQSAASHIPERADGLHSVFVPNETSAAMVLSRPVTAPRPPLILPTPEPIRVVADVPEGPPARFVWRRLAHKVVRHEGPERIAGEWWRMLRPPGAVGEDEPLIPSPHPRDYYRLEDEQGCIYWVFRHGRYQDLDAADPPRWYLHGVFA